MTDSAKKASAEQQSGVALTRCASLRMVLDTPKGRGVFATADIAKGTVIETCPVLVLSPEENRDHVKKTTLFHYTYNWPIEQTNGLTSLSHTQAIVFGLGSLFNHSVRKQNVGWTRDLKHQLVRYHALSDVKAGEELCISYGNHLTFKDTDADDVSDDEEAEDMLGRIEIEGG